VALGIDDGKWFPHVAGSRPSNQTTAQGMSRLCDAVKATGGRSLDNGLDRYENQRLAACHRPSEVAALVSLGLGRRFHARS
jgi:hypothetical protein